MHDVVTYRIEKIPVVRNQQQGTGVTRQPLLQPQQRIEVEVVGGLIKQQHVGGHEQGARQVDAHPPAAGEVSQGPCEIRLTKTEAHQQLSRPRLRTVAIQRLDGAMQLGLTVSVALLPSLAQGALGGTQRMITIQHIVDDCLVQSVNFLGHMRNTLPTAHLDLATVGCQRTQQHSEQAGLAGSVRADDTGLVTGMQG